MTPRQCEIAAEAYTASILARCGYDISVQYGANQPRCDLIAEKLGRVLLVSVKGNKSGAWPIAVSEKKAGLTYHQASEWRVRQGDDIVLVLVQFKNVAIDEAPRIYIARPDEVVDYMKSQNNGDGHGMHCENYRRDHPKSKYSHEIASTWYFSEMRLEEIGRVVGAPLACF